MRETDDNRYLITLTGLCRFRLAGEIQSQLHYGRIEKVFEIGLHEYLMAFLDRINLLNDEINKNFLVPDYT